jgi:hypothetical protein
MAINEARHGQGGIQAVTQIMIWRIANQQAGIVAAISLNHFGNRHAQHRTRPGLTKTLIENHLDRSQNGSRIFKINLARDVLLRRTWRRARHAGSGHCRFHQTLHRSMPTSACESKADELYAMVSPSISHCNHALAARLRPASFSACRTD